jgi:cytidine deaminase
MQINNHSTLIAAATEAAAHAYAPYSKFCVGAALQSTDGRIWTGCNIENASFGLTICAERTALFKAIAAGVRDFTAIAIVAPGPALPMPCGACRQVLQEFGDSDLTVLVTTHEQATGYTTFKLGELLPHAFNLQHDSTTHSGDTP